MDELGIAACIADGGGTMMKRRWIFVCLSVVSAAICAEETDSCAGLEGSGLSQCRNNQQTLRQQERLEKELQQQQERQNQLDRQQREVQQQLESMRLQNEGLRRQLEHEMANNPAPSAAANATNPTRSIDVKRWRADNPWFGTDYARTQFAVRQITQLQQERPDLTGRELLDALSAKVDETFGSKH